MISNFKIGTRLAIAFSAMIAFLVSCCAIGVIMLSTVNDHTHHIISDNVPKSMTSSAMMDDLNEIAIALRNLLLMESDTDSAAQFEIIANARKKIDDKMSFLSRTVVSEEGKAILKRVTEIRDKYVTETDRILALLRDGKKSEARTMLLSSLRFILADYKKALYAMTAFQASRMDAIASESQQSYERSFTLMLAIGTAATLLAALMGYWITRSITRPIGEALKVATTVARGDLTSQIDVTSTDETGQLLRALKEMNHSLASIVGEVRSSTDAINGASSQIAAGNMDLSSRTEQQASSLEETAASMEELTSTVKLNAENATQASELAASASGVARKGGAVVAQVVDTMEAIAQSSGRIVEITSVIEGIAFQTNILALNAAVEAARAGEQGRGFAVVAGEVRTLAQRAAAAAKEIKTLIDDSASKVSTGSKLVGEAGTTMEEIVASVGRVSDLMGEISAATGEQTQGIEQVNEAIAQIDQVTQQNAALVEEASAAAASLQDQAGSLVNAVSVFRISATSGTSSSRTAVRAPATPAADARHQRGDKPKAKLLKAPLRAVAPQSPAVESWEQF